MDSIKQIVKVFSRTMSGALNKRKPCKGAKRPWCKGTTKSPKGYCPACRKQYGRKRKELTAKLNKKLGL